MTYRQSPPPEGMIRASTNCATVTKIEDGWVLNRWTEFDGGAYGWKPVVYPGRKEAEEGAKKWCGL